MNKKTLFEDIKKSFAQDTPDIRSRIDFSVVEDTPVVFPSPRIFSNALVIRLAVLLLVVAVITLGYSLRPAEPLEARILSSEEDVLSYALISSANLLHANIINLNDGAVIFDENRLLIEDDFDQLYAYLMAFEPLLAPKETKSAVKETQLGNFSSRIVFRSKDVNDMPIEYVFDYNKLVLGLETRFEGRIQIENSYYFVIGELQGSTYQLRIYKTLDDMRDYVRVVINTQDKVDTLTYRIVKNHRVVNQAKIELTANQSNVIATYYYEDDEYQARFEMIRNEVAQMRVAFNVKKGAQTEQGQIHIDFDDEDANIRIDIPGQSIREIVRKRGIAGVIPPVTIPGRN